MFKNLLSKVGWGELPSSFGYSIGEKVELPFSWTWHLHKGQKKSDGSPVSVFICGKKDLDPAQGAAAKNAEQLTKTLRHPNVLRAFNSIETEGGFYIVTEEVVPLLSYKLAEGEEHEPAVWGLFQALDGLSFLHASGFTHGLFGPMAIFTTPQGDFRVGSFELCQKGLDTGTAISSRRRVGPMLSGWPEPPSSLQQGGVPSIGIDMWGAAVLMAYVFSTARSGSSGPDVRIDLARAVQDVPAELRKPFQEFLAPKPLRGRSPISEAIALPFFQQNSAVQVFSFLASLQIKSPEEKEAFFEGLPSLLDGLSEGVQKRQVLPDLLAAQKFPGQEAAQVLPAILKISVKLKEEEFREKVAPLVAHLFASPDRAIRFRLLTSLGEMIEFLDDALINDKIFPECVNGFNDSNGPIREATVKSMIFFVPRLKPKTVENRVLKLLVKMMQDPEASIRTNALICVGRVAGQLPAASVSQTLMTVIGMGLKDGFPPCRGAALQTLSHTATVFAPEELAQRLLPGICHRLVDPDQGVADLAFGTLTKLQETIRQMDEERRNAAPVEVGAGQGEASAETSSTSWAQGGSFYNPLAHLSMDKVRQKIMGSMGQSKVDGTPQAAVAGEAADAGGYAPAPPIPRAPNAGMQLGSGVAKSANASAGGMSSSFDFGEEDEGGGWGDDDDDLFGNVGGTPSQPKAAPATDLGDDFFDEFDEPPATSAASRPAPSAPKPAAAAPKAAVLPAKPAAPAKAKSQPAKKLDDADDDFWKEFDM